MRKKMLMLATTAAMIEQFNKNNILILEEMGYEVHVIGNWKVGNPISDERLAEFKVWLEEHHGKWFHMDSTRKPHDLKNNISAYRYVVELIKEHKYHFIHCHTPIGSVIARLAAHKTNTPVIYTAHGFHFYDGAPLINWLLYYPVEKLLSYWTDVLITINKEDYNRAKNKFHAKRTEYVPGVGVDIERFFPDESERCITRKNLNLQDEDIALLSIGELNKNKNHRVIIEIMPQLDSYVHYFIAGQGALEEELKELSKQLGVQDRVHFLGFVGCVERLYRAADVYILPSHREGLNLSIMEAMATGLPVVCGNIRGNIDLVDDCGGRLAQGNYGEVVKELLVSRCLRDMAHYNMKKISNYTVKCVAECMKQIYKDM